MAVPAAMTEMPWIRWLDLDTSIDADGTVQAALTRPKPEHLNHNGAVNAAVAFGVAEVAGAGAAVAGLMDLLGRAYVVVRSGSISYTAPARGGIVAVARAGSAAGTAARTLLGRGEEAAIDVGVLLEDPAGRPTGTSSLTVILRPRRGS